RTAVEVSIFFLPRPDKQFLVFFFKHLRRNETGRYQDDFPYVSLCGHERNFIRCDDRPIVFTHLLPEEHGGRTLLSYCGGGDKLTVTFEAEKLVMFPENGRVYHPAPAQCGGVGLVKSSLAFELSACFEYSSGSKDSHPTHFLWAGQRYALTNELIRLLV
uniref:Chromosome 8 open reading frame 82 n=1 Tax=Leptobrachium leishanense TaxID=445787 RepID=A0A8C5WHS7_9ANUR